MEKTFIIVIFLLVTFFSKAQINHQLTPPNLEGTIKVHTSPEVNQNLVSKENIKNETGSSTSSTTVDETPPPISTPEKAGSDPVPPTNQQPEESNKKKNPNTILWLIIVGLVGILIGRSFKK